MNKNETGALGEKIAGDFLAKNGYFIIETNYRCRDGEIDIIARKADTVIFIEVRTRKSRFFGTPEESITEAKKARMQRLAERYAQEHCDLPPGRRIDVVAIEMDRNNRVSRIELIENAV